MMLGVNLSWSFLRVKGLKQLDYPKEIIRCLVSHVVCYTAVFTVVMQHSSPVGRSVVTESTLKTAV